MPKCLLTLAWLLTLSLGVVAEPTDKQVLELYRRWNLAVAAAADFQGLAPLMSRASLEEIGKMEVKKQQTMFGMMKLMNMLDANKPWTVTGHGRKMGVLVYKLECHDANSKSSNEFPVVEEDGQLKTDFRDPRHK